MCIICKEWMAGKLTSKEALSNLGELIGLKSESDRNPKIKHYYSVIDKILDKEVPMNDNDEELDKRWHEETHED